MTSIDWLAALMALLLIIFTALTFVPAFALWSLAQLTTQRGVVPPAELRPALVRRLAIKNRAACAGGFIALVASTIWLHVAGATTFADGYIAFAALGIGFAIGTVAVSLGQQLSRPDTEVRVARLRTTTIGNYIAPWLRLTAWFTIAATVAYVVVQDALGFGAETPPSATVTRGLISTTIIAAVAVLGLVTFEVAGRVIIHRPQPAGSTAELIVDDTFRAATLQDLLYTPTVFGGYGLVLWVIATPGVREFSGPTVLSLLFFVVFAGYVAFLLQLRGGRQRFLEKLWPNAKSSELIDYSGTLR